jgi:hypothetical protein
MAEYTKLRASPAYGALVDQLASQQAAAQSRATVR